MRSVLALIVLASVLLATPAYACIGCILHGEPAEYEAWSQILAPAKTAPAKTQPVAAPAQPKKNPAAVKPQVLQASDK